MTSMTETGFTLPVKPSMTNSTVAAFLSEAATKRSIAVDTETTGLKMTSVDTALGLSIAYYDDDNKVHSMYFPYEHVDTQYNIDTDLREAIKALIEGAENVIFHHAKFDLPSLETIGIYRTGHFICTMVLAHLINENKPWNGKSLDALSKFYLGESEGKLKMPGFDEYVKAVGWGNVPYVLMRDYATHDTVLTLRLARKLWPMFLAEQPEEVWRRKEKLIRVLIQMSKWGITVDQAKCEALIAEGKIEMEDAVQRLGGVNPASPKQLKELLIDQLGLPVLLWTKPAKGKDPRTHVPQPSFTSAALKEYEELMERQMPNNEIASNILRFRGWQKGVSAFYQAWLDHLSPDGRLRPSYVMHKDPDDGGTVTGRLSCREPNLQQIPRVSDKPWNNQVKKCLVPSPGYVLVEADYSQLELRLATAYAQEASLAAVFREGRDIFTEMSMRLGMTRNDTKTFVYSTQYGAGVNRISTVFGISKAEATRIRENYYATYPGFRRLSERCSVRATASGKIKMWSGRFRHFAKPKDEAHKAMNSLIQGGAADIVESVMIKCFETFVSEDCRLLLQVHDSLVFEVREDQLQHYARLIRDTMTNVNDIFDFKVTFAVDVHYLGGDEVEITDGD